MSVIIDECATMLSRYMVDKAEETISLYKALIRNNIVDKSAIRENLLSLKRDLIGMLFYGNTFTSEQRTIIKKPAIEIIDNFLEELKNER